MPVGVALIDQQGCPENQVGVNRTLGKVDTARGTAYIGILNIISYSSFLTFYLFAARLLNEQQVGVVVFFVFFLNVFPVLTELAVPVASTKYISESLGKGDLKTASRVAKTSNRIVVALTLLFDLPLLLFLPWITQYFGLQSIFTPLLCIIVTSLFTNFLLMASANLQGLTAFGKMAIVSSINYAMGRALSVILIYFGFGLDGVAVGWMIGAIASAVAGYLFLRHRFEQGKADFPSRKLLSYSYPVLVFQLMIIVQSWVDVWVLYAVLSSLPTLGVYYLATAGASVVSIVYIAVTATIFPVISAQYGKRSIEGIRYSLRASSKVLNFLVLPFGTVLAALSPLLIEIMYGQKYLGGYTAFMISTSLAIIPSYMMLYVTVLQAIGDTRPLVAIAAVSFVSDLVAAYYLTIILGLAGTALARAVMYAVSLLLSYAFLRRRVKPPIDLGSLKKTVVLSAVISIPLFFIGMILAEFYLVPVLTRTIVLIAIAVLLFLVAGTALKPLSQDDLNIIRRASPKKLRGLVNFIGKLLSEKNNRHVDENGQ